jgi:hypothetical protein
MRKPAEKIPFPVQAAMAMMFIQLAHKIVREIPHALQQRIGSGLATIASARLLAAGMMLAGRGFRPGLLPGIIDGVRMLFQPILVHGILGRPAVDGIWWYPCFPGHREA